MYNPKSINLIYPNGSYGALSNICLGNGHNKWATVLDLTDAVEDSKNAQQLLLNLNKLNLIGMNDMIIDRDSEFYTRLKGHDPLGNIHYLKIEKIKEN